MKTRTSVLLLLLSCLIFSCKKKKDEPEPAPSPQGGTTTTSYYLPLKIGNSWIYEQYQVDASGNETYNHTDSVYISKDTIIGANTYYVFENATIAGPPSRLFLRQTGSDLVTDGGMYYYMHQDTTTVLENYYQTGSSTTDTISHIVSRMGSINKTVMIAAGTFTTNSFNTTVKVWPAYKVCCDTLRKYRRFAENVGVVSEVNVLFVSGVHIDRRLLRYHLN